MSSPVVKVKIDSKAVMTALAKAPIEVSRVIRVEMKKQLQAITNSARVNHRFTTRTGMLERSIDKSVDESGLIGIVYLNMALAPYARRIHEGGGGGTDSLGRRMTNRPDQFLYQAFEKLKFQVWDAMNNAVSRALKKVGL